MVAYSKVVLGEPKSSWQVRLRHQQRIQSAPKLLRGSPLSIGILNVALYKNQARTWVTCRGDHWLRKSLLHKQEGKISQNIKKACTWNHKDEHFSLLGGTQLCVLPPHSLGHRGLTPQNQYRKRKKAEITETHISLALQGARIYESYDLVLIPNLKGRRTLCQFYLISLFLRI